MDQHIFKRSEPFQMQPQLRVAHAGIITRILAAKTIIVVCSAGCRGALFNNQFLNQLQQAACLRRQFVERTAEHFMREPCCRHDVGRSRFDVAYDAVALGDGFDWAADAGAASAIVSISVRYFSWSRRVRVRSSRNVSRSA